MWPYIRSFVIILLCLAVGKLFAQWQTLLPASISGMLILFIGLSSNLIKPDWVQLGAEGLLKYMALLFVPVGVGLIDHLDQLQHYALAISLSVVLGTSLTLLVVGHCFQWLLKRRGSHD